MWKFRPAIAKQIQEHEAKKDKDLLTQDQVEFGNLAKEKFPHKFGLNVFRTASSLCKKNSYATKKFDEEFGFNITI